VWGCKIKITTGKRTRKTVKQRTEGNTEERKKIGGNYRKGQMCQHRNAGGIRKKQTRENMNHKPLVKVETHNTNGAENKKGRGGRVMWVEDKWNR